MKRFLFTVAIVAATGSLAAPAGAADVGVSVTIGEPGFYGRIDIGDFPQPQVIYRRPVFIEPVPVDRSPIYLRVPPGHAKHWSKHCHRYNACGERVYFVRDSWYQREYVPRFQERHRDNRDERRHDRRDERRDDHRRDRQGDDHDRGRGH